VHCRQQVQAQRIGVLTALVGHFIEEGFIQKSFIELPTERQ
jgi:hypothetical protein